MHLMGERVHLPHSFRLQTISVGRQGQRRNGTGFLLACFRSAFSLMLSKTPCLGGTAAGNDLNQLITKHPLLKCVHWPS